MCDSITEDQIRIGEGLSRGRVSFFNKPEGLQLYPKSTITAVTVTPRNCLGITLSKPFSGGSRDKSGYTVLLNP